MVAAATRTQCTGEARVQARRSVPKTSLANIPPTALAPMRGMSYTPLIPTKPETFNFCRSSFGGTCGRRNTPAVLPSAWVESPVVNSVDDDDGNANDGGSRSCLDGNDGDFRVVVAAAVAEAGVAAAVVTVAVVVAVGAVEGGEVTMPTSSSQRGSARHRAARCAPALCPTRTRSF